MTHGPEYRGERLVSGVDVPPGTPAWISMELVEHTIAVWQRYYTKPLTVEEAIGIIEGTGRLLEVLSREPTS